MIPLCNPRAQYRSMKGEIDSAVQRVMDSGRYIGGDEVESFEREFAEYLGIHHAHCVGVSSGTTALRLALDALNVGRGDKVIVPAFTFFATAEVVSRAGATPVFVDVRTRTGCLDPDRVEEELKRWQGDVKAIIVVHLYGHPAEMSAFVELGKRYGVPIIEDACQALGAEYLGKKVGTIGDFGCFSFFPSKTLGCMGDGGLVVTQDEGLCWVTSELRDHGRDRYGHHINVGTNGRLGALQAAILRAKLPYLPIWIAQRNELADYYRSGLSECSGVVQMHQGITEDLRAAWNYYTIRLPWLNFGPTPSLLRDHLAQQGILSQAYYHTPIHLQPAYRETKVRSEQGDLSLTERLSREVLSLPIYPELTNERVDTVVDAVKNFFKDE